MRLKGIYRPTLTASAIEAIVKEHLSNKKVQGKNNDHVSLEVKDLYTEKPLTLKVTFFALKKGDLLHGRTISGEHVFIKLGKQTERAVHHPSVVVSISEKSSGSTNVLSKRR